MGQRAHTHRQEYRAIRKQRRQLRMALKAMPLLAENMQKFAETILTSFAQAVAKAQKELNLFFAELSLHPFTPPLLHEIRGPELKMLTSRSLNVTHPPRSSDAQ